MTGNIVDRVVKPLKEAAKSLVFRYTKFGVPTYPYNIEPAQLALLVNELDRLRDVKGNIVEIGVARGLTTRFLCQHIVNEKLENTLTLYAVDTFDSFVQAHLDFEVKERGKSLFCCEGLFISWVKLVAQDRFPMCPASTLHKL